MLKLTAREFIQKRNKISYFPSQTGEAAWSKEWSLYSHSVRQNGVSCILSQQQQRDSLTTALPRLTLHSASSTTYRHICGQIWYIMLELIRKHHLLSPPTWQESLVLKLLVNLRWNCEFSQNSESLWPWTVDDRINCGWSSSLKLLDFEPKKGARCNIKWESLRGAL